MGEATNAQREFLWEQLSYASCEVIISNETMQGTINWNLEDVICMIRQPVNKILYKSVYII